MTEANTQEVEGPVLEPGVIWTASVSEIGEQEVVVSLGQEAVGFFERREAQAVGGDLMVKPGDEVEVLVDEREGERWVVSMEKAEKIRVFDRLRALARDKAEVTGVVTRRVRQGLAMDIGVRALLPARDSGLRGSEMRQAVGTSLRCQVVKYDVRKNEVILSRKALSESEQKEKREALFSQLEVGQRVKGAVRSLAQYGAFIDLGGVDGLLHVSEMGWGRVNHPGDLLAVGDEVEVEIVEINPKRDRIGLSRKNLVENPWEAFARKYPEGTRAEGTVSSLTDFGAFVNVDGVEGLVHVSEVSWDRGVQNAAELLSVDQQVEVVVLKIEPARQRIGLSIKRLEPNPWEAMMSEIEVGAKRKGAVRNITDFGVFVELKPGVEGLVHVSEMSWSKRIDKPSDLRDFTEGEEIEVMVLEVNPERQRISLGLKQLEVDPWESAGPELRDGGTLTVTISRITGFGAFATIAPGLEGLIHVSEMSVDRVERVEEVVKVGQEIKVRVLSADRDKRKVSLSIKAQLEADGGAMRQYTDEGGANNALAAALQAKGFVPTSEEEAAPSEKAPEVEAAPVEAAPVEAAPVEAAPAEEAEAAPVEEPAAEATEPVEAAPVEEPAAEEVAVEEPAAVEAPAEGAAEAEGEEEAEEKAEG